MPRKRKKSVKAVKPVIKQSTTEPEDLRIYTAEAEHVNLMTASEGWAILSRDIAEYKEAIGSRLAYMNPNGKEYEDARIIFMASDKLIKMVEDYAENRRRALELLDKLDNPEENIILDVDN